MSERAWVTATTIALLGLASPPASADEPTAELCASTAEHASDLRDGGKLREAATSFAACARDACPRIVREDCRRALADLQGKGPHLVPRVRDAAGHDVLGLALTLDDAPLPDDVHVSGMLVDPGPHVLRARRDGVVVAETTVLVAAGDGLRTIDLALPAPPAPVTPRAAPPAARLPLVVGGVGLAVVGIGAALGIATYADYRALRDDCSPGCSAARVDPVRTRGLVADVLVGTGLVTLAVAVVLRLGAARPPSARTAATPSTGLTW